MAGAPAVSRRKLSLELSIAALGVLGTLLLGVSLAWNVSQIRDRTLEEALVQARVAYEKDIVFRRWNSQHGGIYVDARVTPPNPYLAGIPERDLTTPSGKPLTLVNPAYMTRQLYELEATVSGLHGHITSLEPMREQNAPDPWERAALESFNRGVAEVHAVQPMDGLEYMRLMRPLITEEGCLACHHEPGYVLGKPWGGISVSVPMRELRAIEWKGMRTVIIAHLALWLIGLAGVTLGGRSLLASERGLRRAEEEARTAAQRLQESNRLKDLFIDIVRHDLLNPASVIRYYTTFLQEGERDPTKKECYLKIEGVNNRLMDLIRNASKYSRLEEMDHVDCQTLDLGTLLLDALAVHEHRLRETGLAVNYLPRGEYPITANPMLEDVFANLVANAIKYAADGKRLEIDILDQGDCWLVQVRDFGSGIPDKDKPLIFTRFTRLQKEGVRGSGLGLAIVKRLVDLHKGRIWVEDNPAGGSVFCVRLPKAGPQSTGCTDTVST
ncbi:MAG TPA: ATP-binding protein [Candidatus Methanoperedens sp.]|nr:ATP-binding protein [Candidatus Methanoperedens sp.]